KFMLRPGVFHLRHYLSLERQQDLARRCLALHDGEVPAYVPGVRGGGRMHVRMLCLGRHWNRKIYRYEPTRADFDDLPVPPIPEELRSLASEIARVVGMTLDPDVCILNHYGADGRLGLHQDKDESEATLAAGVPVVSLNRRHRTVSGRRCAPQGSDDAAHARVGGRVRARW